MPWLSSTDTSESPAGDQSTKEHIVIYGNQIWVWAALNCSQLLFGESVHSIPRLHRRSNCKAHMLCCSHGTKFSL